MSINNSNPFKYYKDFILKKESTTLFKSLNKKIKWKQESVYLFGKQLNLDRKVAWYGDKEATYSYSNKKMIPKPWISELLNIKTKLYTKLNLNFNSVLLNYYPDGNSGMGWHSDNEKELGNNPIILSLSLGAERDFIFKNKLHQNNKIKIKLNNGSLLLMNHDCQTYWKHCLPKRKKVTESRINLTFRNIVLNNRKILY